MTNDVMKTGTTTIGIVCKDGIVLAADKRATSGNFIVTKAVTKIFEIAEGMAVTMAGTVSDAQLLVKLIQAEIRLKDVRTDRKTTVVEAANMLASLVYANIRKMSLIPGISHFLLGGRDEIGFYLYDVFADGSLTLAEDFVASGSGSITAYGVLETQYKKDMSCDDGVKLVVKAINAALQRDSASGGGIDVVKIMGKGVERVADKKLDTTITL